MPAAIRNNLHGARLRVHIAHALQMEKWIDTSASQHDNARALRRVIRSAPSPNKPRHMDVYPSRNVDTCLHRVPAPHNNLNASGDRLRSAGAFLD